MIAIPPVAQAVHGEDSFYLGIAMLFIFSLAALCTWILGKLIK